MTSEHLVFASPVVEFYNLKHPKHNLKIQINGKTEIAAVVRFAYTPTSVPRKARDNDKLRSAKQWNNDYYKALVASRKPWQGVEFPAYAVLVKEQEVPFTNSRGKTAAKKIPVYNSTATVYAWRPGVVTIEGQP